MSLFIKTSYRHTFVLKKTSIIRQEGGTPPCPSSPVPEHWYLGSFFFFHWLFTEFFFIGLSLLK
jgi:hypothetical protein